MRGRYKKLQKLASLSLKTISEFGFRYFVTAALWELKTKKLAVFEPEIEIINLQPTDTQLYMMWLRDHLVTDDVITKMKNEVLLFRDRPKITIVVLIFKFDKYALEKTLHSLNKQIYENFEICLFHVQSDIKEDDRIFEISDSNIKNKLKLETSMSNEIVTRSTGDYISFLKAGDILSTDALFRMVQILNQNPSIDIIYCDEERIDGKGTRTPFFKPDWSPDLFLSFDYISNFYMVKTKLFQKADGFRKEFGRALHYDLLLRLTETTGQIYHIPFIITSIHTQENSNEPIPLQKVETEHKKALLMALERRKIKGEVTAGLLRNTFRIRYNLDSEPKVSIIIPTKDQKDLLKRCLSNIEKKTSYKNYEIIIVDNDSQKEETITYLRSLPYTVIKYDAPFNFSKINNLAVKQASGEFLLFLNDDAAPLESGWLTEMVSIGNQYLVGVVGPKLVFAGNKIQHAGLILSKNGAGFHPFSGLNARETGYFGFLNMIKNYSAVTGACMLIRKELFDEVGGFDEVLDLYYQDADLCLKIIEKGYRVIYTPYAILLHQGSSTIKKSTKAFFAVENHYHFIKKWPRLKKGDPFYNPNLGWDYRISV